MKSIIQTLIYILCSLTILAQGNYDFENEVFKFIKKNETAQKHGIKTISYYPSYKDSLNKGKCGKIETYDSAGTLSQVLISPNSKKEYKNYSFVYDNDKKLKEVWYYLPKWKGPFHIIHLDYYPSNQLKSMTKNIINSNNPRPDTLFYYYTKEGRYDYKEWNYNRSNKMFIRYNKCNEIEYIDEFPLKAESIELDSNGCIIFTELGIDKSYLRRIYNTNCQNLTEYFQYNFGKSFQVSLEGMNLMRITDSLRLPILKAKLKPSKNVKIN